MAYVRQRGNQLAIVHGVRDPESKKVEQRILFTLYSKAEALAALGKGEKDGAFRFRSLLERSHPTIRFEWEDIFKGIAANLEVLPETYDSRDTRLRREFRDHLLSFARQLVLADPQTLAASSQLLSEHRKELEYVGHLIDSRLEALDGPEEAEAPEDEGRADHAFSWCFATRDMDVPPDVEEDAAELYEQHEYERANVAFKLLTDAFEDYAEGHNYLGLIALEQGRLEEAIACFRKTMEVGRRALPKRVAKGMWWSDLKTRPYMRGLRNLALALNQAKRYDEALDACEQLVEECHDHVTAAAHRAAVSLNTGHWKEALRAAQYIHLSSPSESVVAAFAAFELARLDEARALFLHAMLNAPRAVGMLMGMNPGRPKSAEEIDAHNTGVSLLLALADYLQKRRPAARRFFSDLWQDERMTKYRKELEDVTRRWRGDREGKDRGAFERMSTLRSWEFAKAECMPAPVVHRREPPSRRVIH